jgi:drug/metabolite transporter (DMT)-like permease
VLISSIAFATLSLFGKKLSQDYNAWTILFYIFSFGTITLFIFQLGAPDPWPAGTGIIPLFTGLVVISSIIGFTLYTIALKELPASIASITATTEIFFVSILAYIFLQERMDFSQVMGAALIISGVLLVSLPKKNSAGGVTL